MPAKWLCRAWAICWRGWWELSRVLQKHKQKGAWRPLTRLAALGFVGRQSASILLHQRWIRSDSKGRADALCMEMPILFGMLITPAPASEWGSVILPQISTTFRTILLQQLWWTDAIIYMYLSDSCNRWAMLLCPSCSKLFQHLSEDWHLPKKTRASLEVPGHLLIDSLKASGEGLFCLEKYRKLWHHVTPDHSRAANIKMQAQLTG